MQKITPFLWFNNNLDEALNFYSGVFKDAKIGNIMRQQPDGPAFSATFQLNGQDFMALNGGPMFKFTPAVSFFVSCKNQEEVDYYWEKLTEGGLEEQCGWLRDKFGLSWQIIPEALGEYLYDTDPEKANSAMQAMLGMKKIVIEDLKRAHDGQ